MEIMVTVAIISIMSGSVVIGFNSFGETVRVQETAGVITDMVKNLELEMIRRDYKKQTIHFEEDYLVIEAEVENQYLELEWNPSGGCGADEEELVVKNASPPTPVYLAQRDQYGNNIKITPYITASEPVCIEFLESEDTEVQYQVFRSSQVSQIIRFIHFNVRRDGSDESPAIVDNKYTLEISSPYAAKEFYDDGNPPGGPVVLTVKKDDSEEDITLQ